MSRSYFAGQIEFDDTGLEDFENEIKRIAEKLASEDAALDVMEAGVKEFVRDLRRLPKPRSRIDEDGYTHLVDTFTWERTKTTIKVGWGKYYGPMLEHGTRKMKAQAHLKPLFERNKGIYYRAMIQDLTGGRNGY